MFEIIFLVLAIGMMALIWWWLKRRRTELLGGTSEESGDGGWPTQQPTLNRDALVNRSREFDPSAWDDSPDPGRSRPAKPSAPRPAPARPAPTRPAPAGSSANEDEPPVFFDREFLERRQRERTADDDGAGAPRAD